MRLLNGSQLTKSTALANMAGESKSSQMVFVCADGSNIPAGGLEFRHELLFI